MTGATTTNFNLPTIWRGVESGKTYRIEWTERGTLDGWDSSSVAIDAVDIYGDEPMLSTNRHCPAVWTRDNAGDWTATINA